MSCLVVGSIAFDTIETPGRSVERVIGGSATYFANAAKHFCPVHVVGVIGRDFDDECLRVFKHPNIDIQGVARSDGLTFHWKGRYKNGLAEAETLETELNVFADFSPVIPENYRSPQTIFLANIDPVLQLSVLDSANKADLVILDTMNLWIKIKRADLENVLKRVDVLILNEQEAEMLVGEGPVVEAVQKLQKFGPSTVIIKRGGAGAFLRHHDKDFLIPAYPVSILTDTTGAGDSFAGGFLGYLTRKKKYDFENLKTAIAAGTVLASFVIEGFSIERTQDLSLELINKRFSAFLDMVSIERKGSIE